MNRFRNILAIYDSGPGSDDVLRQAVSLARCNDAKLTVVDSWEYPKPPNIIDDARRHLSRIEPWIRHEGAIDVTTDVLVGPPHVEIIRRVIRHGHDLVIVSSECGRTLKGIVFGNTATNLMLKCPCDIWVLKPGQPVPCRNIVAAVDLNGDETGEDDLDLKIIDLAASLATAQDAHLHAVHFWEVEGKDAELLKTEIRRETTREILTRHETMRRNSLNALLARHQHPQLAVQTHLRRGRPNINLADMAIELSADLIVMGTACRLGIPRLLMGNFSETVLNGGRCSVLSVKPDGFRVPASLEHRLAPEGADMRRHAEAVSG